MTQRPPAPSKPAVYVYPDVDTLSRAAARALAARTRTAVEAEGRCAVALSGGTTPRTLYRFLARDFAARIPWGQVDLFWGDERYVPPDDPRSNYAMAKETLIAHVPIPATNVHPMSTAPADSEEAARAYDALLAKRFVGPWPRFDVLLLGLAADGHIASLFPGSPAITITDRRVAAVTVPADPPRRLTVTLPVINHAAAVFFLVAGKGKAGAVHRALVEPGDPVACPAAGVRPAAGEVIWWVDEAAATFLGPTVRAPSPPS